MRDWFVAKLLVFGNDHNSFNSLAKAGFMLKCDYQGTCKNKAYAEVYPSILGGKHKGRGWSYLCRKHFFQEEKIFKNKLPAYILKNR